MITKVNKINLGQSKYEYFWGFLAMAATQSTDRCNVAKLIVDNTAMSGAMIAAVMMLFATGILKND